MNGLNSLSVLDNDIQSLAQKVYTGKELDRVNAFYNEHCEIVEKELNELEAYKKLEEQIGCSLEVKCKICTGRSIYLPNGKAYLIAGVRDSYFTIKVEDGCTETVDNKEYGISWWLKENRSE